jgi:hypothetical protein
MRSKLSDYLENPTLHECDYPIEAWLAVVEGHKAPGKAPIDKLTILFDGCTVTSHYTEDHLDEIQKGGGDTYAGERPVPIRSAVTETGVVVEWEMKSPCAYYQASSRRLFICGKLEEEVRSMVRHGYAA